MSWLDCRTLISDLLESGTYIGDVKVIARHASESTTLRYAKAHDTKPRQAGVLIAFSRAIHDPIDPSDTPLRLKPLNVIDDH